MKLFHFSWMGHDPVDLREARHGPHAVRGRGGRRRAIVRAALELAGEEGREALSLARLADRVGLTTTALHREFDSMDAVVAEMQRSVIQALARATEECVVAADRRRVDAGRSTQERALLAIVVSALVFERFARDVPAELALLAMDPGQAAATDPTCAGSPDVETRSSAFAALAERLRDAQRCGAIAQGDASERAVGLWAGLQGVAQTRQLSGPAATRIDAARIAEGLISALLVGWGADPDAIARLIDRARSERFAETSTTSLEDLAGADTSANR